MATKTQFIGPISSGVNAGAVALNTRGNVRFTQHTTIGTVPVTGLTVLAIPSDGVLQEILITTRAFIPGEAVIRFGTGINGSDNLGAVTVSAIGRYSVALTTAVTTFPLGRPSPSALATPIYLSTGATSGALTALANATIVAVTYTRLPLSDDPQATSPHFENNTVYRGPITTGVDRGFPMAQNSLAYAKLTQYTTIASAPVTGQVVGCLAPGAKIDDISVYVRTAIPGEAIVRFAVNDATGSDNLGSVSVSGIGRFTANTVTAMTTLPWGVNNTASALPVYASVVPVSGAATNLANNLVVDLQITRYGEKMGYGGPGQKETNFRQALASGERRGYTGPPDKQIGWARFTQLTTVGTNTTGVLSAVQIGTVPFGAYLADVVYNLRGPVGGEMRTRITTNGTLFLSDLLGSASLSAAGRYSIISPTANFTFPGGVNRTGTDIPIYLSTLSLSGSISNMTANSVVELVYVRLDPTIYGG